MWRTFGLWAEFLDQGEKIAWLEQYRAGLQEEVQSVEERIAALKGEEA